MKFEFEPKELIKKYEARVSQLAETVAIPVKDEDQAHEVEEALDLIKKYNENLVLLNQLNSSGWLVECYEDDLDGGLREASLPDGGRFHIFSNYKMNRVYIVDQEYGNYIYLTPKQVMAWLKSTKAKEVKPKLNASPIARAVSYIKDATNHFIEGEENTVTEQDVRELYEDFPKVSDKKSSGTFRVEEY